MGTTIKLVAGAAESGPVFDTVYLTAASVNSDSDGDGRADNLDNCPTVPNIGWLDSDGDLIGDACDEDNDSDGDGYSNTVDLCPNTWSDDNNIDSDNDGIGDACDIDEHNDFENDDTESQDTDGDGYGDNADLDDDNDGVPDDGDCFPKDASERCETIVAAQAGVSAPTPLSFDVTPGSTDYTSGVDGDGLARIVVPVAVVPGVNGLAPRLAVTYDSGLMGYLAENNMSQGVLGYGWSLQGISRIHRCENKIENAPDVSYTNTDSLCIDGEILVPVVGTNFSSGAEYRTEQDTFARIKPEGSGFKVWTHDGRILTYGVNPTHQVSAGLQTAIYLWALEKEEDRFGNFIAYSYIKDDTVGEIYPDEITYEGASVKFEYAARPPDSITTTVVSADDPATTGVDETSFVQSSVYLHKIAVSMNAKAVRDYRVENTISEDDSRVRVTGIQHCGYDEDGNNIQCLNPLEFDWDKTETYLGVNEVTDSLGAVTRFTYVPHIAGQVPRLPVEASVPNFHSLAPAGNCTLDEHLNDNSAEYNRRAYVSKSETYNGLGSGGSESFTTRYYFAKEEPRFELGNRGYVGHQVVVVKNVYDLTDTSNDYAVYSQSHLCFPLSGRVAEQHVYEGDSPSNTPLTQTETLWKIETLANSSLFVFAEKVVGINYESGQQLGAIETVNDYDYVDSVPSQLTSTENIAADATWDGNWWSLGTSLRTQSTDVEYTVETGSWLNSFIGSVTTAQSDGGPDTKSQTVTFTQKPGTLAVEKTTESRGDSGSLITDVSYNAQGNPTTVTQSGTGLASRVISLTDYASFRYPGKITNGEEEETNQTFDLRFGTPVTIATADGRSSLIQRDPFGRVVLVEDTTSSSTETALNVVFEEAYDTVYGHTRSYVAKVSDTSRPDQHIYYDQLGRPISRAQAAFEAGDWNVRDSGYDNLGRLVAESLPYTQAGSSIGESDHALKEVVGYDRRHRITSRTQPDGGAVSYSYTVTGTELKVTATEAVKWIDEQGIEQQESIENHQYFNVLGQLVRTTDDALTDTNFTYDPLGNLTSSKVGYDAATQATMMVYDAIGQRKSISEPHTSTTNFTYTALGQLESQTNGELRVIKYNYDLAGRLTARFDDDQLDDNKTVNSWYYGDTDGNPDTSGNCPGQTVVDGRLMWDSQNIGNDNTTEFIRCYSYDTATGKTSAIETKIDNADVTETIEVAYTYTDKGHVRDVTYDGVTVTNLYDDQGHHYRVTKGSTPLQTVTGKNAYNQAIETDFGNGLKTTRTFDPASGRLTGINTGQGNVQNLTYNWRTDSILKSRTEGSNTETFAYDSLRRLTSSAVDSHPFRTLDYGYSPLGNLTSKTSSVLSDTNVTSYVYDAAQPNAVTEVSIGNDSYTLGYDDVGNVTSIGPTLAPTVANTRTFEYNASNHVKKISVEDETSTLIASEEFAYTPDGEIYFRKSYGKDSSGVDETTYTVYALRDKIERVITPGEANRTKIKTSRDTIYRKESDETLYLHRDHLGSVHVVTDASGDTSWVLGFDPYGERRVADMSGSLPIDDWQEMTDSLESLVLDSYTDHTSLDRVGVIHMKGRIYDPVIGRFLNADPIVADITDSQSFNRYSYVKNSPVSFVDPTGYSAVSQDGNRCDACEDEEDEELKKWLRDILRLFEKDGYFNKQATDAVRFSQSVNAQYSEKDIGFNSLMGFAASYDVQHGEYSLPKVVKPSGHLFANIIDAGLDGARAIQLTMGSRGRSEFWVAVRPTNRILDFLLRRQPGFYRTRPKFGGEGTIRNFSPPYDTVLFVHDHEYGNEPSDDDFEAARSLNAMGMIINLSTGRVILFDQNRVVTPLIEGGDP